MNSIGVQYIALQFQAQCHSQFIASVLRSLPFQSNSHFSPLLYSPTASLFLCKPSREKPVLTSSTTRLTFSNKCTLLGKTRCRTLKSPLNRRGVIVQKAWNIWVKWKEKRGEEDRTARAQGGTANVRDKSMTTLRGCTPRMRGTLRNLSEWFKT